MVFPSHFATITGTPLFMAPEVLIHSRYGLKADVWSYGCLVAEVIDEGRPPWP
eukprot:gene29867-12733_t